MNKTEFVEALSSHMDTTKAEAHRIVEGVLDTIKSALSKGQRVELTGFGTFEVRNRAARMGRNPQTGAALQIKASKNPAFKPGKKLKDAVS